VQARETLLNPVGLGSPSRPWFRGTRRRTEDAFRRTVFARACARGSNIEKGSLWFHFAKLTHRLRRGSRRGPRQGGACASSSARSPLVGLPCGSLWRRDHDASGRLLPFKRLDHEHPCTRCFRCVRSLRFELDPRGLWTALTTRRRICTRDARAVPSRTRRRDRRTLRFTTLGPLSRDDRR